MSDADPLSDDLGRAASGVARGAFPRGELLEDRVGVVGGIDAKDTIDILIFKYQYDQKLPVHTASNPKCLELSCARITISTIKSFP